MRLFKPILSAALFALALLSQSASALVIELYSDANVTFLAGPADAPFADAFTSTDFADARNGDNAYVTSTASSWISEATFAGGGGNSNATWISDKPSGGSEGSSVLYAIDFDVALSSIASATLDFYWSVDNTLGSGVNAGLFLNESAVSGVSGGTYTTVSSETAIDVTSLIQSGTNTLYINATDTGGPAGLIFSATLTIQEGQPPTGVPAPPAIALLGLGLVLLWERQRKTL